MYSVLTGAASAVRVAAATTSASTSAPRRCSRCAARTANAILQLALDRSSRYGCRKPRHGGTNPPVNPLSSACDCEAWPTRGHARGMCVDRRRPWASVMRPIDYWNAAALYARRVPELCRELQFGNIVRKNTRGPRLRRHRARGAQVARSAPQFDASLAHRVGNVAMRSTSQRTLVIADVGRLCFSVAPKFLRQPFPQHRLRRGGWPHRLRLSRNPNVHAGQRTPPTDATKS